MEGCEGIHLPQTPFLGYSLLLTMKNALGLARSDWAVCYSAAFINLWMYLIEILFLHGRSFNTQIYKGLPIGNHQKKAFKS